jgi:superfamily I DNA/RNA helicase
VLRSRRLEDWSGRALRFWRLVESGALALPHYDFIYVDEAQFFAPIWFQALRRALRPDGGRLFLAADPTQGFLKRRQSWLACGLDLRGRSMRLRRSYRNARPILEFAADFYRRRLGDEEDDVNLPDEVELSSAPSGDEPRLIELGSRQDEVARVAHEIGAWLRAGGAPGDVLVIVATGRRTKSTAAMLETIIGRGRISDARQSAATDRVRICALDGATGLEAPIVFVVGAAELLEKEGDLGMSQSQREELLRDNTRRLYMAFTRAAQRLVVTWVGTVPEGWGKTAAEVGESASC